MYVWLWMVVERAVWYPGRVVPLEYCCCWRWGEVVRVAVCRFCAPRICGI